MFTCDVLSSPPKSPIIPPKAFPHLVELLFTKYSSPLFSISNLIFLIVFPVILTGSLKFPNIPPTEPFCVLIERFEIVLSAKFVVVGEL